MHDAENTVTVDDFKKLDLDVMEKTFQTNIFAMFYLTKEALNYMKGGDLHR